MIKKIFAKLVNYVGTRENNSQTIHKFAERNEDERRFSQEKHDLIMERRGQKYKDEGTTIPTGQVERHDEASEKAGE